MSRAPATSGLRMWGYCLLLTAAAFVQQPGRLVGDTKFDLVVDPARFLSRAWNLWDPLAAFGQVQNQAYGYFWPMGPFFVAGDLVRLPGWVVQRAWWAVLLCLAFVGVVRLAGALRIGTPGSRVLAGFGYALSAHVLTLLGPTSVEAWPTALAPWVLLPLVIGAERGSPRRAAALAALAVAMCGGVNAVAVAAVLPVGVVWLLTRERGPRRRVLLTWWPLLTVVATLWWSVPLVLLGRVSPPFLDYIENAPITTSTTSLPDVLTGTSDWVAYASPLDWVAGHLLGTTPLLLVDAAVVTGLGLLGICRRDNPHARFLLLSVVLGVVIVTFGWAGPVHGWFADGRQAALDGALAPLRNLHKFDVVLRLPLVLGLAHLVGGFAPGRARTRPAGQGAAALRAGVLLAALFSVVGVAIPVISGQLAPGAPVREVPGYWRQAADYLAAHQRDGRALELPASAFGDYLWGSPHDDVLQGLTRSPWAVRNIVPLAQPGNVRFLDAVTRATELGSPNDHLAGFLDSNGVGLLVVRNDLAPFRADSPNPVVLHQALDRSPGITRVASFGPGVGTAAKGTTRDGRRVFTDRGRSAVYPAVEIYRVGDGARAVSGWQASTVPVVSGDPGSRLGTDAYRTPAILAGDLGPGRSAGRVYLTDGLARRETAFTSVRQNQSAAMTARQPWRLHSVEHAHRLYEDQARWETTAVWQGIAGVSASSSEAWADANPPIVPASAPAAAVDGRAWTQFVSAGRHGAKGQWWQLRLRRVRAVPWVTVTMGSTPGSSRVTRLELRTDAGSVEVPAPAPRDSATFALPAGATRTLRIRAVAVAHDQPEAQFALAEARLPGVTPRRLLATPARALRGDPDEIVLTRDPQRSACAVVGATTTCDDFLRTRSEDANGLARRVTLEAPADYRVSLTARLGLGPSAARAVARGLPVSVVSSSSLSRDPRGSALATVDGDLGTTWVAGTEPDPRLLVRWRAPARVGRVQLLLGADAAASRARKVTVSAAGERRVVILDAQGRGRFRPLDTRSLTITFDRTVPAYSAEAGALVRLPVGVSELRLPQVPASRRMSRYAPVRLPCGAGPTLHTETTTTRTRVTTSLAELTGGGPLSAQTCRSARVSLHAGRNTLLVSPNPVTVPQQLVLDRVGSTAVTPQPVPVRLRSWQPDRRAVVVPARAAPTLLVVEENLNPGWRATVAGRSLTAQRVDGWKQGFVVPAGVGGTVSLTYTPDRPYQLALLLGLAALAVVALVAWRSRRDRLLAPLGTAEGAAWADATAFAVAGGLLAGWFGVALVVVALVARRDATLRRAGGWAAAVLAGLAGVTMALLRAHTFHAASVTAQVLACLALAAAVLGTSGPTFFSRRNGRSRR